MLGRRSHVVLQVPQDYHYGLWPTNAAELFWNGNFFRLAKYRAKQGFEPLGKPSRLYIDSGTRSAT
jgi:hypothetical protein